MINGAKLGNVDVAWTIVFYFRGVTQEWLSSVFKISHVFWIAVLSSFSIWDYIIVCDKLVVYDVWFAENDNTGFLSVGVDIFDWLYLKELPIYLPTVPKSTINQIYDKYYYVRKIDKIDVCEIFDMFGLSLPNGIRRKIEKWQIICFDECWKYIF